MPLITCAHLRYLNILWSPKSVCRILQSFRCQYSGAVPRNFHGYMPHMLDKFPRPWVPGAFFAHENIGPGAVFVCSLLTPGAFFGCSPLTARRCHTRMPEARARRMVEDDDDIFITTHASATGVIPSGALHSRPTEPDLTGAIVLNDNDNVLALQSFDRLVRTAGRARSAGRGEPSRGRRKRSQRGD